jgi:predicted acyltransferase
MMPSRMSTLHQPTFSTEPAPSRAAWARAERGPLAGRVRSLDVFRGITMAGMILVNNSGDWSHVYAPLEHSKWDGCTPTDLVFPFFLFIVGVAIPFSLASRRRKLAEAGLDLQEQNGAIVWNTIRRTAILFGLGLLLYATPINLHRPPGGGASGMGILDPGTLRIPGVLQRIALCYGAAALLATFTTWRTRGFVAASLLIVYTLLMRFVPVPGFGPGNLTVDGSLASFLDRTLLGHHTYKSNYDPEGLLSTLPAIGTALIGTLAGEWLRRIRPPSEKASGILAAGVVLTILGYVTNGLLLPINKALWTPSYVLYTGGLALLGFGLCYFLVDVHGHERWARPFTILGMNAITVYVLSGLIGRLTLMIKVPTAGTDKPVFLKVWLYDHLFAPMTAGPIHLSPYVASMMWGLSYVLIFLALAAWMYRRKWFLKA